jgi:formylglycine-generating enzyme required for sulfatase activity
MEKFYTLRVMPGGGWISIPAWVRSASPDVEEPSLRSDRLGFRVARTN